MHSHSGFIGPWPVLLFAGILLAFSQVTPTLWWGTLLGLVLFLLGVWRLSSWRKAAVGGLLVGTLKAMGGFAWVWHTYPLDWLSIDNVGLQFFLIGLYWLTTSIFMGAGIALPAIVAYYLRSRTGLVIAIFPIVWLVGEVLGSLSASLWLLGPGSYLNIYIGHGYAGLPLAQFNWLLPFMSAGGLYGLTYVAALIGVLLTLAVVRQNRVALVGVSILLFLTVTLNIFVTAEKDGVIGLKVIAVDTTFTADSQKTDIGRVTKQREVTAAIIAAAKHHPDIILLPEDSRFSRAYAEPDDARRRLQLLLPEFNGIVVDTARIDTDAGAILRAFYHDMSADRTYITDKQFLVPQGEYVTYPFHFLLKLFGQNEVIARTDRNQNYIPGPIADYQDFPSNIPPMIFCFESSSVFGIERIKDRQSIPLILHPISHSWFNDPYILEYQLEAMLKVQAVWNKVMVITAGNMTESMIYYPDGRMEEGSEIQATPGWRLVSYEL